MKLLYVTPNFPYPPRRGYTLMAYHQIKHLAQRHTVDLVSFKSTDGNTDETGGLSEWCRRVERIDLPKWQSWLNVGWGLLADRPLQVSYLRSARMAAVIDAQLRQESYDVVIFQLTRMAQYRPIWYTGATILSLVDPFVLNYERSLAWRSWYTRPVVRDEIARLKRYESQQAKLFDRLLLITEADARDYQPLLGSSNVDWVSHGVDVDAFRPSASIARCPGMIVITGNMHHAPNINAVEYFCQEIFPLIQKQESAAHLYLVGSRPAVAVRKWAKHPNITVTGFVPDVKLYLNQAMVSVCPIRLKVGTQTKVLESLAMGTPVVTTSAGNHGVGGTTDKHLYVCDTPAEFAEKVVSLLRGKSWLDLSQSGRQFVEENFTWAQSANRLEQILTQVAGEKVSIGVQ
jgi:sugar transferase (PEP-CTERM/EpsH1 system associated)